MEKRLIRLLTSFMTPCDNYWVYFLSIRYKNADKESYWENNMHYLLRKLLAIMNVNRHRSLTFLVSFFVFFYSRKWWTILVVFTHNCSIQRDILQWMYRVFVKSTWFFIQSAYIIDMFYIVGIIINTGVWYFIQYCLIHEYRVFRYTPKKSTKWFCFTIYLSLHLYYIFWKHIKI